MSVRLLKNSPRLSFRGAEGDEESPFIIRRFLAGLTASLLLAGIVSLTACHKSQKSGTALIKINGDSPGRTFDGIGAVSAGASSRLLIDYPEPYRRQILDYLFKPDYGASLQHLKVEIGSDANSTDGSEPSHMRTRNDQNYDRGYEWWLMEEAHKRNPQIVLDSLAWGAPGWIGNGNFYSQDMANYVVNFVRGAQKAHHLDIAYTGIWNETHYQPDYVKLLKLTLQDNGLKTRVVCCDLYPGEHQWSMIDQMQHDPELRKAIDVVGVHYPHKNGHVTTPKDALNIGKPLWATEDQGGVDNKLIFYPGANRWDLKGRGLAHLYNINYIEGRLTATEVWSPITSYYDILPAPRSGLMTANTPWSGHYELPATLWVTAHTTQFTQPGWKYLDSACGYLAGRGTFVTLRSPNSGDYSVILETVAAKSPQKVSFQVTGGLSTGAVHVWETNGTKTFEHVTDITPQQGSFSLTLDPDSIYTVSTTTGQAKGTAQPPPDKPFPFPYHENFDHTDQGRSPRYFADQDGAFEAWHCTGRSGRCLFQVIEKTPIRWANILPDPYTLLGDEKWTDYEVSSDVLLENPGNVTIMGRIDSADYFQDGKKHYPSGYILSIDQNGNWKLLNSKYKVATVTLASGTASFGLNSWHKLALAFHGLSIRAMIDGKTVANVNDSTHAHGMVGIGSGWNRAEFDNFQVQ